jgi:hypothetical protein
MSTERKNPLKRDQALNDATSGQLGEAPRDESVPKDIVSTGKDSRLKQRENYQDM